MAVVNLPDSPANGTTQTVNGITYTYNSSKGYWTTASSGTATIQVTTSDSAPSSPADGDLWYDTDTGGIFVYYADGTSNQWVEVIGQQGEQGPQGTLSTSDSAPSSPSDGDLWYDTDVGGLFIYYADGSSNQWVEVVGQQGAQGPAGPSGATTIVADTTALLAISSPSTGEMAYVTGNSTLYFWNGSGWYKIALINTTPSISGANASYSLATDGTATTVTIVASDPEGLPITYSIASDTSGNIATVAQGTGASTNVWTITPSTNTAHAGTFSLTFRASDGVNFATAASSFTLQFFVQNSKYTTALITSVGANNAVNTSFDDKSTSDHTITANGDAHQTTFSPYRHGGYSAYFDGTGDNLTTTSAILSTSGAFTVQCWVYLDDTSNATIWAQGTSGNAARAGLSIESGNWYAQIGSAAINTTAAVANIWKFLEFQYDGSQIELFIDGTSVGTASNTTNAQNTGLFIGKLWAANYDLQGYVTDLRVINGTPTGSSTVPTERLTAVTNTSLLTCHLPYFIDGSTNSHSITVNGNTSIKPFTPYNAQEYSAASHGGSARLDGTGDFLSVADHADFEFGSGDFTMEAWIYLTGYSNSYGGYYAGGIMGKDSASNRSLTFSVQGTSNSYTGLQLYLFNGGTSYSTIGTASMGLNQWYHVAATRASGTVKLFLNGTQIQSATNSTNIDNTTSPFVVGASSSYSNYEYRLNGNLSDARVVKGTAIYTGNFTPPTAPLTAVTDTKLLVQSTDAGIIDKSQSIGSIILQGDTKSSTTYTKYLSTSIKFDGTGDDIKLPQTSLNLGAEDFTVEAWVYTTSSANQGIVGSYRYADGVGAWHLNVNYNSHKVRFFIRHSGGSVVDGQFESGTFPQNAWTHVAVTRDGANLRAFINGTQAGSTNTSLGTAAIDNAITNYYVGNDTTSALDWNGYMSDVRITKGLARYTSNFTAPTAALQG